MIGHHANCSVGTCGIVGRDVTSIAELLMERGHNCPPPSLEEVSQVVRKSFERVMGVSTYDGESLM